MASGGRWGVVLVFCTRVQDVRVGDKLDVADVEDHVEGEALASLFEDFDGFELLGGERGDDSCVGEAGERPDVVGVPSALLLACA